MDLHQQFEHLAGSFCVPKAVTIPPCLTVKFFAPFLAVFCRVWLYRFLRTQSKKFTCVCFGTERLTLLAHIILVLSLSYTGLTTLLWHRRLLRIGTRVVIRILRHRCIWCRLLLIAHLDASRVGRRRDSSNARRGSCRGALPTRASPRCLLTAYSLGRRSRPLGREWV